MNILYFSSRQCFPCLTGARLRDYHLARYVASHASVTYVGLRDPLAPAPPPIPEPHPFKAMLNWPKDRAYTPVKIIGGIIGPTPLTLLNYWSPSVAAQLKQVLEQNAFDTIQIEGVHLLPYLPVIRQAAPKARLIADWHNIESEILWRYSETNPSWARRLVARRTASLLQQSENALLENCHYHAVASQREAEKLQVRCPQARLEVISNGVDVEYYRPQVALPAEPPKDILFVGSMDYHANIDAAIWIIDEIWPLIRASHPQFRLLIVGRDPSPEILKRAAPGVIVTGTVDDVRSFYRSAAVVLTPLRVGSGTRLKILEAMAAGVPVVSTTLGAEGLDVQPGGNILFADTTNAIAQAVSQLIESPQLVEAITSRALETVRDHYDWSSLGAKLLDIHKTACS
jgi:glycosyltransferase involved in cell wall biosynthesis